MRLSTIRPNLRLAAPMTMTKRRLARSVVRLRLEAVEAVEADERENLLAQLKNFVLVDAVNFIVGNASDFDDRGDRNGVEPAGHAKQKCLDAGES